MCSNKLKQALIGFSATLIVVAPIIVAPSVAKMHEPQSPVYPVPRQPQERKPTVESAARAPIGAQNRTRGQNQRRIDIEMLTRAEQRLDALRTQVASLQMRESELQSRIDELDYQMKPESLQRALAFVGSVRPMDELRASLRARLQNEKNRTTTQLDALVATRVKLEAAIRETEAECARLRERLRVDS